MMTPFSGNSSTKICNAIEQACAEKAQDIFHVAAWEDCKCLPTCFETNYRLSSEVDTYDE
jgi:hypothetical protein